jgi:hypothetical protein
MDVELSGDEVLDEGNKLKEFFMTSCKELSVFVYIYIYIYFLSKFP